MTIDEAFAKWVIKRKTKTGFIVKCKKGLFSVEANSEELAMKEAKHYFWQYFEDGEYD